MPQEVAADIRIEMPGSKISQLVGNYDREKDEPTQNQTDNRYQLRDTDLGVPFQYGNRTYLLFGDTHGGVAGDRDAIAYTTDTNPEDGLALDFIHDKDGIYQPVSIPSISQGAFEVPVEGVSVNDEMYIYHTTDHSSQETMGRSVVARSNDGGNTFNFLYTLSIQHFINVSIVKVSSANGEPFPGSEEDGLVMFGSGRYRESNVYLAWQATSEIENPQAIHYFSGVDENNEPLWSDTESKAIPLFEQPCVGELSVSYNSYISRWIILYNCGDPRGINMRTAKYPWGPWTKPQVLFGPWEDGGYCNFMHTSWNFDKCDEIQDPGRENEWGGEYGPYQFENFATGDSESTTIYFTMSTWNPYTVVLMKAKLKK